MDLKKERKIMKNLNAWYLILIHDNRVKELKVLLHFELTDSFLM